MVEFTRRRALQAGLAAGAGALGGCVGLPSGTDRDPADRRISLDPSPPAGTWPRVRFDLGGTRHNPGASPPRSTPTVDWTVSTSESAWVVVGPENVYVDADGETIALSPDGSERWRAPVEGRLYYAAERLYVATGDPGDPGPLVGLDPESGAEVWRSHSEIEINDVVEASGTVYVAEDFSGVSEPGKLYGLHADTGAKRWQIEANERNPTFVVVDGRLAVVTTYAAATIDVSNRSAPTPEWTEFSMLTPSPSTATGCGDGSLFYGTTSAVVRYSYDEDEFEWRTGLDDWNVTQILVNEDTVFATGTGGPPGSESPALTAIDRESGERRWKIDGPFTWGTAVGGDTLVVPTDVEFCENGSSRSGCTFDDRALDMGGLNGLDPTTGDVRWSIREERFGEENGNAVLVGDRIYYTDDEGLHALS